MSRSCCFLAVLAAGVLVVAASRSAIGASPDGQPTAGLSAEERGRIERGLKDLNDRLVKLRADPSVKPDYRTDAEIYAKGITWALRHEQTLTATDGALLKKALERGNERAAALEIGKHPWAEKKGKVVRAFVSAVDGSVQPYGVIVPAKYDPGKPIRLDVVLHGSTRPVGTSELRFLSRFDEGDAASKAAPEQDFIELHPLGRVENCYRWAGETDVFEAIEAVCRNYRIDRDRIVLRGMSMGASGTWHLGLKHPDRFVALGPYCGYVDTHQFSQTPLPNFVKVGPLPPYQEKALHLLDSIDYAANAGVVPAIACMGEKDVFFQTHVLMGRAMEKEGLKMVNLISPGTGHVIDPVTHREQMRRIGECARKGIDHAPRHLRFVTWTLKYSCCHWLRILALDEHYSRAEVEVDVAEDGSMDVKEPRNVRAFAIRPPVPPQNGAYLRVGGQKTARLPRGEGRPAELFVRRRGDQWELSAGASTPTGKRPGMQGPIDDAFTSSFLCVRGTGKAWNPAVKAWSDANLKRFAYEWHRYFRGELPIKDDTAVTEDDLRRCNLILFGDPGCNRWILQVVPKLPIRWTRQEIQFGKQRYPAADHVPVLIHPNPLAEGRYIVLNSGHTFHEKELASLNYLLFPRLGDWAVLKVGGKIPKEPSGPLEESVCQAGFFDEDWKLAGQPEPAAKAGQRLAPFFRPPAELTGDLGNYRSPLTFADGRPVRNADDWRKRRQKILKTWHEVMGPWPALIEKPKIEYLQKERRENLTQHHVRLEVAPGLTTEDAYLVVPDGKGPFPAVLVVFYDAKTGIGRGKSERCDFAYQLAKRGFVTLSLGGAPAAFYPNKEKARLQPLSFHAYVAANCRNALASLPQVAGKRIGVLGHSYGGKWAMFAACLDDKFACGVWSDPGIVFDETRGNVNYWEPWYLGYEPGRERKPGIPTEKNPRTGAYKKLIEAGHDLHELQALMAPRPFLVSGGSEDPPERWKALNHVVAVNDLLGYKDRVAMTNRKGHTPTEESNELIYRFLENVLKARQSGGSVEEKK
jgi:dienelactone hydrolase